MASSSSTNKKIDNELVFDSDLAFELQLQEALDASLSSPSSSTHVPEDSDDFIQFMSDKFNRQEQEYDDRELSEAIDASLILSSSQPQLPEPTTLPANDDVSEFIKHMLDEIIRMEQEYEDREMSEAEARRMRDDLNRRIHDQKVAAEILNIPDEDWAKDGDNFEKPYEIGASSSLYESGEVVNQEFRVYFKGLVSEERVKDSIVRVSGIGVAICDSRDNVIFEVKKRLLDDDGVTRSSESVGFEALIEGMQAATDWGLKRINCLCDEYMTYWMYQNVEELLSMENEIPLSCLKALSLRENFTDFKLSLVARNDLKFAFKLARDAIVSQITCPAETKQERKLIETCQICLEDVDNDKMFSVDGCFHRYCFFCMKQHVEVKLLNGTLPKCPHEGCKSNVIIDRCRSFLEPKFVDIMSQRIKEASIPVSEKIYCPYARCSTLMSKKEVFEYTNNEFSLGAEPTGMRKCTTCFKLFCVNCKIPWHHNTRSCSDYKKANPNAYPGDVKLKSLASKNKWRQCEKCSHMIELSEGCYHMSCRCGYQFCYTCGAEWKNKKATCSCPIWDEHNIIRT